MGRTDCKLLGSEASANPSWRPKPFMCTTITLAASHEPTGTTSNEITGAVAHPTRLSISAPSTVKVGEPFNITGKLEYRDRDGVWKGLAGRTVTLYYNGTKIGDVTTGSDGSYSKSARITTPGTYTLKAVYAGEGLALVAEALMKILSAGSAAIFLVK